MFPQIVIEDELLLCYRIDKWPDDLEEGVDVPGDYVIADQVMLFALSRDDNSLLITSARPRRSG